MENSPSSPSFVSILPPELVCTIFEQLSDYLALFRSVDRIWRNFIDLYLNHKDIKHTGLSLALKNPSIFQWALKYNLKLPKLTISHLKTHNILSHYRLPISFLFDEKSSIFPPFCVETLSFCVRLGRYDILVHGFEIPWIKNAVLSNRQTILDFILMIIYDSSKEIVDWLKINIDFFYYAFVTYNLRHPSTSVQTKLQTIFNKADSFGYLISQHFERKSFKFEVLSHSCQQFPFLVKIILQMSGISLDLPNLILLLSLDKHNLHNNLIYLSPSIYFHNWNTSLFTTSLENKNLDLFSRLISEFSQTFPFTDWKFWLFGRVKDIILTYDWLEGIKYLNLNYGDSAFAIVFHGFNFYEITKPINPQIIVYCHNNSLLKQSDIGFMLLENLRLSANIESVFEPIDQSGINIVEMILNTNLTIEYFYDFVNAHGNNFYHCWILLHILYLASNTFDHINNQVLPHNEVVTTFLYFVHQSVIQKHVKDFLTVIPTFAKQLDIPLSSLMCSQRSFGENRNFKLDPHVYLALKDFYQVEPLMITYFSYLTPPLLDYIKAKNTITKCDSCCIHVFIQKDPTSKHAMDVYNWIKLNKIRLPVPLFNGLIFFLIYHDILDELTSLYDFSNKLKCFTVVPKFCPITQKHIDLLIQMNIFEPSSLQSFCVLHRFVHPFVDNNNKKRQKIK